MSKHKSSVPKAKSASRAPAGSRRVGGEPPPGVAEPRGGFFSSPATRETIESIVIAFILAFLFRTFEAEAFVIPTGSMAPTLLGRHKSVDCPICGYHYSVSASEEVTPEGASLGSGARVVRSTCPMCGYTADLSPGNSQRRDYPPMKGDRILVNKFYYDLCDPQRWDVAVFKYPGEAQTNFIKRLVGLPNETIRIWHGDIYIRDDARPEGRFEIARKPPHKLLAMLQPVFDNDFSPALMRWGWPSRWWPEPSASGAPIWRSSEDQREFTVDGSAAGEAWLRYRHRVPRPDEWQRAVRQGQAPPGEVARPTLISDFTAYNSAQQYSGGRWRDAGPFWVGDLAVEFDLEVRSAQGEAIVELVEGGRRFRCRFDLSSGQAELSISGMDMIDFRPVAATAVRAPGIHRVRFANCDNQLLLWVDDRLVEFDRPTTFPELGNHRPTPADLSPVGIAASGASLKVEKLRILRDIYYIARRSTTKGNVTSSFTEHDYPLDEPERWQHLDEPEYVEFALGEGQYLALGDNSDKSKDSRLWAGGPPPSGEPPLDFFVRRELLTGKAMFIYWPDTPYKFRVPLTNLRIPFFPNVGDMQFVR